jgi:mRNA interferase MazF
MATAPTPSRGEVWLIDFDPSIGAEIRKKRPAAVVSVDSIGRLPIRLVVPLTDWRPQYATYPWFVSIPSTSANGLAKGSGADAFQVKSLAVQRFARRLGKVTRRQIEDIASAVALCVGAP